jgi:uncharacterized protein (TIGR02145 family)
MDPKNILIITLLIISMANLKSQDYTLNFDGAGASNKIDTIIVKNLTKGTSVILYGNTALHLKADLNIPTGINPPDQETEHELSFSPNPMKKFSLMTFEMAQPGPTVIELFDVSGRKIAQTQESLPSGRHTFRIEGLKSGIYILRQTALGYSYVGKLISGSEEVDKVNITYVNSARPERKNAMKSASDDSVMQYNTGDTLLMTFISDDYKTTLSDMPETDKTIVCNFYECRDFQNKNYPVVQIGDQVWMAENLKSTVYYDGTNIPKVTDPDEWCQLTSPAYCWYANDSITYSHLYGPLYNWYTVNTGKLCPAGWHVPSSEEWSALIDYVGGQELAGGRLKETGTDHWNSPNTGATNSVGFSALPGGHRYGIIKSDKGVFGGVGQSGSWWTASEYIDSIQAIPYGIESNMRSISSGGTTSFISGHNVRCIGPVVPIPKISTANVTEISQTSALCGGFIINDQDSVILGRGVCWSTRPEPDTTDNKTIDDLDSDSFISNITGLTPNTVYYVRAYATNGSGTGYGKAISFKTKTDKEHFVLDMDGNEYDTIVIGDQIWMKENLKTTKYNDGTNIPKAIIDETGILPVTPAYRWQKDDSSFYKETYGALYNWYVVESGKVCPTGWHVPADIEWTMLEKYLGGRDVAGGKMREAGTEHWYEPNTGADNSSGFTALPGTRIGDLGFWWSSSEIYGCCGWSRYLENSTTVSFRMYINKIAMNSIRCMKYADHRTPVLTTTRVDAITQTDASGGGSIVYDGGSPVTSFGVCWDKNPNPEITDNKTMDGEGTTDFISRLTGLDAHTTYYVRAYATNESGTGYGEELTFTTLPVINGDSIYNADSIVDLDGNVYKTVKIGEQIWLAENLKTTRYNSGIEIPMVKESHLWSSLKTGGYCWYDHDSAFYEKDYGKLYNWYAVNTGDLCPSGWHVPSQTEWLELINNLGGNTLSGGKLKESGFGHWPSPNIGATNESGFTALPGGNRHPGGDLFLDRPYDGYWWSATLNESDAPVYINLNYASVLISINWYTKEAGFSVRCMGPGLPVPELTTDSIVNVTQTSATCWGTLNADLSLNISTRGVCWSTSPDPDISNDKTADGNGTGSTASSLSGLTPNTVYYVRAYAIYNSVVTYGNQLTFATP